MLDFKIQCPVPYDFPVATERFDKIFARALGQIKSLGLESAIHLADRKSPVAPEGLLGCLAQVLDLGPELDAKGRQLFRNLEFMNEVLSLFEFREVDFHHARSAVVIGRMDNQLGLLQKVGRNRVSVKAKKGAEDHLGRSSLDQTFPVEVNGGVQLVALGEMVKLGEGAEGTVPQNQVPSARAVAEWDMDDSFLVLRIFRSLEPYGCLGTFCVVPVHDPELVPGWPDFFQDSEIPLGDEGPAALSVPYELDYVDARLFQFRKVKAPLRPEHRRFPVLDDAFPSCAQPVQVDRGVDRAEVSGVMVEGVDLEGFDQESLDVLDRELEPDGFVGPEEFLVVVRKVEVDPFAQAVDGAG